MFFNFPESLPYISLSRPHPPFMIFTIALNKQSLSSFFLSFFLFPHLIIMLSTPLLFNFSPHLFSRREGNHIEDFSSYWLFEATGDSEADSLVDPGSSAAAAEFNDAESCTDDTPVVRDEFERDENEDEGEEEMLENDEVVESKSTASIDSTKEFKMLNEVDKNRLFWEACLAS